MSDNKERAGVELYLEVARYNREVEAAIAKAGEFEAAWKTAMGGIGDASVTVKVNTAELETAQRSLGDLAAENPNIVILTDDAELDTAKAKVADIDAAAPSVPISTTDTGLNEVKGKLDDIDKAKPKPKVGANTSSAETSLNQIKGKLEDLKKLTALDLVISASGTGLSVLQQALDLVTSTDEAVRTLAARTGTEIPGAAQIIDDLYTANWGESKQQIAEVLALSAQLGVEQENLAAATQSAFEVASVTGGDVNEILRAQSQLIKGGVVSSYQEAADFIVVGYQNGLDVGGDLIDSTIEYATTLKELGFTGSQALSVLNSGIETGIDNTDRIVDLFREFNVRASNIDETGAQEAFSTLGLDNEAELFRQGQISGPEFFDGVVSALQNVDPAQRQQLGTAIFGTIFEDFGSEAVLGITSANSTFDVIDGRATESATLINDTLGGAIDTLFRTVEVEAQNFLSSDQINLDQKIDDIKNGITSVIDNLKSGKGLAESLEIGLQIPGFADSVHRFEASIGEFAIGILELIAGVQEFLGKDSSGTRGQIAQLAGDQLAFNLKVANPDEIQGEIDRAVARGVNPERITEAIGTAATELISGGEIAQAQELLDNLSQVRYVAKAGLNDIERTAAEIALRQVEAGTLTNEQLQSAVDRGLLVPVQVDAVQFQDEIDVAMKAGREQFDAAVQSGDFSLAQSIADNLGDSGALFTEAFNKAINEGDFDLAESIVTGNEGAINPSALIVVDAFREQARAARLAAFEELGGFEDAGAEGGAAGKSGFITTTSEPIDPVALDQMKAGKDLADLLGQTVNAVSATVISDSDAMATAAEDADTRVASAFVDNTMTTSFETVRDVAADTMPEMAGIFTDSVGQMIASEIAFTNQTNILTGALLGMLAQTGPGIVNLMTNLANISANAGSAAGALSAAYAAGAAGGQTTVNNNFNVNSVATGVATGQAMATTLNGQGG